MKAIYFILIILGIIIAYAFISEYATTKNLFGSFKLTLQPVEEKSVDSPSYYKPYTAQTEKTIEKPIEKPALKPTVSEYIGKVKIFSIQKASIYQPSMITLTVAPYKGDPINLTGWTIQTRKGSFIVPQGIEEYEPFPTDKYPKDIIIKDHVTVYLINDENPLGRNKNFRANKCFGYLRDKYTFSPSIYYGYCPKPKLEDVSHLQPECQEFILRLPSCQIPEYADNNKILFDMECRNYMDTIFSYRSCVKNHSEDNDFLKGYWYVYLSSNIVEELHDTIYLYDKNSLLVDKYLY